MYTHHLVTTLLLLLSWNGQYVGIGILVLAAHDISDIPLDMLKMMNYLGWGAPFGCCDGSGGVQHFAVVMVVAGWT